ncbi:EamA family transporter [Anaerococcus lactolyticus]|uniref:Membrane protein n=2 Tax=Anaerococcus lactolyticus TaxID=33032 RepID=A0A095X469_9FIRM|nr:EamA family transporter [Anaerococcus lactolyticus]EEI85352.1 putative membrane protein [Anaerococcus lactolyticus ATCC 51172]KGF04880.1 membrane protein [Anaerococcus lactolyticus S7-1-13]
MAYIYALISAIFAALTSILAKIGISDINSNLATAIRTTVVLVFSWLMVFVVGGQHDLGAISKKSLVFIILSGLSTGISWLAFYKALQMTDASKIVAIDKLSVVFTIIFAFLILGEAASKKAILGTILIGLGTLIMVI